MEIKIEIPQGINVEVAPKKIIASYQNKKIEREFKVKNIILKRENNKVVIKTRNDKKKTIACANTLHSHIKNIFKGLLEGFEYKLAVVHSHFPMNITKKENLIEIKNFLGEKSPRYAKVLGNVDVQIKGKEIIVKGYNLWDVSQTAANLENATRVSMRDRRRFQDGIYIVHKGK